MVKQVRELTRDEVIAAEDALMDFQFAVMDAMREQDISQSDFAKMLGVSRARVSQMLSSEANPTIKLVGRALHLLGLKTDYKGKSCDEAAEARNEIAEEGFPAIEVAFEDTDFRWFAQQRGTLNVWHTGAPVGANSNSPEILEAA